MTQDRSKSEISIQDHQRITQAIRDAERHTNGEIFAVVAQQSDDYFYIAGFFAAVWALIIGLVLALVGWVAQFTLSVSALAAAQVASFAVSMVIFHFVPGLRMWFVPRAVAYRRASNNAVRQFLAHGIHTTDQRSGILIFVSLAERYAEIVADAGINEKVEQHRWDEMMGHLLEGAKSGQLADGFVTVIEEAGALLGHHFPADDVNRNELDDRLIEL